MRALIIFIVMSLLSTVSEAREEPANQTTATSGAPKAREVKIAAGRFSFAPNTITVREGDQIRLVVSSMDVAHSISIPTLDIQQAIPANGDPITIEFIASPAGTHQFSCSIYCGVNHKEMSGTITIVPKDGNQKSETVYIPIENDFTVVTLPTTKPLPRHKGAFRLTHRFARPLGDGSFGDLAGDLFGFDSSALIGFEYRFGLTSSTQIGGYRSSNRTIQIFGQQQLLRQASHHFGLDLFGSIEGINNFQEEFSPAFGAIISRTIATRFSVYAEPIWVGNTNNENLLHSQIGLNSNEVSTFIVGLGARVTLWRSLLGVAEIVPRAAGFKNGNHHATLGAEFHLGGHFFQLNFSNSLGTTPAQVAQGGSRNDWFIGFNISRRFF